MSNSWFAMVYRVDSSKVIIYIYNLIGFSNFRGNCGSAMYFSISKYVLEL